MAQKSTKTTPRRTHPGQAVAPAAGEARALAVTTFRLYRDQLIGLQREAFERRAVGTAGRVDASAILREILDEHFKHRPRP
jgi:hypothetical protein